MRTPSRVSTDATLPAPRPSRSAARAVGRRRPARRGGASESGAGDLRQPVAGGGAGREPRRGRRAAMPSAAAAARSAAIGSSASRVGRGARRRPSRRSRPCRRAGSRRWPRSRPAGGRRRRAGPRCASMTKGEPMRVRRIAAKPAGSLQRGAGVDRGRHRVGAERRGGQGADGVAAEDRAGLVGDQRPVAVAVGGDERVEAVLRDPVADPRGVLGGDGLGVDRHEVVGAAERHRPRRRVAPSVGDDQVAAGGAVLRRARCAGRRGSPAPKKSTQRAT